MYCVSPSTAVYKWDLFHDKMLGGIPLLICPPACRIEIENLGGRGNSVYLFLVVVLIDDDLFCMDVVNG